MDIIYLDYYKAFNSVVHSKLLAKLECYSNKSHDPELLTIVLCKIAGICSTTSYVISSVPRGSVVYVNDICNVVPTGITVKLFADDTKLYFTF